MGLDCLVGYSGFVGQNLLSAHEFPAKFNSRNIADIRGGSFATVVCAAAPAAMWAANKDPESDLANIRGLIAHLEKVKARRFVLVSTVAVLADAAAGLDEGTDRFEAAKAYGRNRRLLEEACAAMFETAHIVRLPALYGVGLKKNFLFDILNPVPSFLTKDKFIELSAGLPPDASAVLDAVYSFADGLGMFQCHRERLTGEARDRLTRALFDIGFTALNFTNADSTFQYYGLSRLWADIDRATHNALPLVHLAPEPLLAHVVYRELTGGTLETRSAPLYHEDMQTRHAKLWGGPPHYIQSGAEVLADLKVFFGKAQSA